MNDNLKQVQMQFNLNVTMTNVEELKLCRYGLRLIVST